MLFKPELTTKDQVMAWYRSRDNSCFVIFTGVRCDPKLVFAKHLAEEDGGAKLETVLNFIVENGQNTNTYTIISVPYEEGIEAFKIKDMEGETIRFQFNTSLYQAQKENNQVSITNMFPENEKIDHAKFAINFLQQQNAELMQNIRTLQEQILQQQNNDPFEEEPEEPEEPTAKERILGTLAGLIEKPAVQEGLASAIGAIGVLIAAKFSKNNDRGNENYTS